MLNLKYKIIKFVMNIVIKVGDQILDGKLF